MSRFIEELTGGLGNAAEDSADERGRYEDRDRRDERLPESDPLAMFHRLPAPAVESGDLAAMKAAVAELRRARELARKSDEITGEFPAFPAADVAAPRAVALRRRSRSWRLPAIAAALLAGLAIFGIGGGPAATLASAGHAGEAVAAALPAPLPEGVASHLPLVEDLDPRQAELIQIEDEGMSLVVVLAAGRF